MIDSLSNFLFEIAPRSADLRLTMAILAALLAAYILNRLAEWAVRKLSHTIAQHTDNAPTDLRYQRLRRLETFISIGMAIIRVAVVSVALMIAWQASSPATAPWAVIGASTFFLVLAGATITPLLRDVTYGFVMTAEHWYNVGDHVMIDPFMDLQGVVEQITLRSTKLRSLTGEVIWVHNQHIQAVRVTPRAVRTIAIEIFVSDLTAGERLVDETLKTLPAGPMMVTRKVAISETEQLSDNLWRITAKGQTVLGREWLIEDFAVQALKQKDGRARKPVIVHGPIVRYVDATAEKRFRRSVRSNAAK
jgi:small conductance mechanosensitive channel